MSASVNRTVFATYFDQFGFASVHFSGRLHPVTTFTLDEMIKDGVFCSNDEEEPLNVDLEEILRRPEKQLMVKYSTQ